MGARLFPVAIYAAWALLLARILKTGRRDQLKLLIVASALGGPAEMIGLKTGAFEYERPSLPDIFVGGAPIWSGVGWGMALTGIWMGAAAIRRTCRMPETLVTQVITAAIVSVLTILPGEFSAVRFGVWRWTQPDRLPLALFSERLQVPLGTFVPPALLAVLLGRIVGARRD